MSWLGLATIVQLFGGLSAPLMPSFSLFYGAYLLGILAVFV
jgi:hypothetical protein